MNPTRIYAIILRFLFLLRKNLDRWAEVFVFPMVNVMLWGMTSTFFTSVTPESSGRTFGSPTFILATVSGIIFWEILYRVQMEIPMDTLEELWNKSLLNLFCSPLKFSEWITGFLSLGLIKITITAVVASSFAFFLYHVKIFVYGFYLIPFLLSLLLCGWWLGFFVAGLILRYGTGFQAFAWTLGVILSPFSAIYYPVAILPHWAQAISHILPTSYIFEGMRGVIQTGVLDWTKIATSVSISFVYLVLAALFLKMNFKTRLERGLLSLE